MHNRATELHLASARLVKRTRRRAQPLENPRRSTGETPSAATVGARRSVLATGRPSERTARRSRWVFLFSRVAPRVAFGSARSDVVGARPGSGTPAYPQARPSRVGTAQSTPPRPHSPNPRHSRTAHFCSKGRKIGPFTLAASLLGSLPRNGSAPLRCSQRQRKPTGRR